MQGFLCWLGVWVFLLFQSRVCGIVELNYEFDIVKLIKQLEDTEEYSQKVNVLFVLGQTYQYSCPFHDDNTDDVVMYRDIMSSSSKERLYELLDSHSSPCVSSVGYTNELTTPFDCRVCALYCYASARNLVSGVKITHVYFNYAGMLNDLGLLYSYVNNAPKAIEVFEEAISINYTASSALINLATLENKLNNHERSLELFQLAVEVLNTTDYRRDHYASLLYNYGLLLHSLDRVIEAEIYWEYAMNMGNYLAIANLASLMSVNGTVLTIPDAQRMYHQSMEIALEKKDFHSYWNIKFQAAVSVIPVIPQSVGEVLASRTSLMSNLLDLISDAASGEIIVMPLESIGSGSLGYYVIYQGYIDYYLRQLQATAYWATARPSLTSSYARQDPIYYDVSPLYSNDSSSYRYIATTVAPGSVQRIKVGFLSSFFYHHSVGLLLKGVIKQLNQQKFDIHILAIHSDSLMDDSYVLHEFEAVLGEAAIHLLDGSLDTIRSQIQSLNLDIVVFGEIGMNEISYFLAFHRLAKRSVVFWGHALTSGITGVNRHSNPDDAESIGPDYYVSSRLFERESGRYAQFHYSERVVLMDTLTTYFEVPPRSLRVVDIDPTASNQEELFNKKQFLLYLNPELSSILDSVEPFYLVSVPQTLYKVHLSFDDVIRQLLIQMNGGNSTQHPPTYLVFPVGSHSSARRAIQTRLYNAVGPELYNYILFIRFMSSMEYVTLCSVSDLVLDPYPVGGGRSSLEIFSTGTPIVYQYTNVTILQLTHAMYTTMGIDVTYLLSYNNNQYLENIKYLLHHPTYLQELRSNITINCHKLYNDNKVVMEWEKLFTYILSVPRPQPQRLTHQDVRHIYSQEYAIQHDNWLEEELSRVVFNYIEPAIMLANVSIDRAFGTVVKVPRSYIDTNELVTSIPRDLVPHYSINFWLDKEYDQVDPVRVDMVLVPPTSETRSELPWDYGHQCLQTLHEHQVFGKLKLLYMCSLVGKGVTRLLSHEKSILIPVSLTYYNQAIKTTLKTYAGDDVGHALSDFKHYLFSLQDSFESLIPDDIVYMYELVTREVTQQYSYLIEEMSSVTAVKHRKDIAREFIRVVQQETMIPGFDPILPTCGIKETAVATTQLEEGVTLVISTCKRLQYFKAVMDSLLPLIKEGKLFVKVVVIDDNSSAADRDYMRQAYPFVDFIMKEEAQQGHAVSMNIMMSVVTTRYLVYLEDDWLLNADPIIHETGVGYTSKYTNIFAAVVSMALDIILSSRGTEPIHQVLFNSQVSRECAVGDKKLCNVEEISRGGWHRTVTSPENATIHYSIHEFGLMDTSYSDRIHSFSHWPAFSFNPGLWDMQAVKEKLRICLNTTDPMNITDPLFEQRFSTTTLAAGLDMAYLPMVVFTHIGDISAYKLNQVQRPFDAQ